MSEIIRDDPGYDFWLFIQQQEPKGLRTLDDGRWAFIGHTDQEVDTMIGAYNQNKAEHYRVWPHIEQVINGWRQTELETDDSWAGEERRLKAAEAQRWHLADPLDGPPTGSPDVSEYPYVQEEFANIQTPYDWLIGMGQFTKQTITVNAERDVAQVWYILDGQTQQIIKHSAGVKRKWKINAERLQLTETDLNRVTTAILKDLNDLYKAQR